MLTFDEFKATAHKSPKLIEDFSLECRKAVMFFDTDCYIHQYHNSAAWWFEDGTDENQFATYDEAVEYLYHHWYVIYHPYISSKIEFTYYFWSSDYNTFFYNSHCNDEDLAEQKLLEALTGITGSPAYIVHGLTDEDGINISAVHVDDKIYHVYTANDLDTAEKHRFLNFDELTEIG